MTVQQQVTTVIVTNLPNSTCLGELLLFPGLRTHAATAEQVQSGLARIAVQLSKHDSPEKRYRRIETATPAIREIVFDLSPKKGLIGWSDTLPVRLAYVVWEETPRHFVGYLPALGIEVVARTEDELLERASSHARLLLGRLGLSSNLRKWVQLADLSDVQLVSDHIAVDALTPLQAAKRLASQNEETPERSELQHAASNLTDLKLDPAYEIEPLLNRLIDALTSSHGRPVLLVGPSGVGKTAAIHELVRQRQRFGLGDQAFWQTDGARLVAGMTGFGMWQERCTKIVHELRKSKAILFLGNLVELMQVGQHEGNAQGIASFFKPYLMRGEIQAIAECTDEQRKLIELQDPHLLSMFEELNLAQPNVAPRRRMLKAVASQSKSEGSPSITDDALDRVDDLHQRFATYSVAPGRPIRFLKNLIKETSSDESIGPSQVTKAFAQETGLPLFMIDEKIKFDPDATQAWLSERLIGQPQAVQCMVDVLTVVKANLSRPSRPISSLLFIGPTGVGKTQMAKSLTEYLFGDADRMTRFDMSEYSDAYSVTRLTQAPSGSNSVTACGEGLLTSKVREQPFGVLLFDEFEKAHPSFFDLLLQILGEGRLTDGAGRLADFTNAVIIMTSNLGAKAFQTDRFGFATDQSASQSADQSDHFIEAVRNALRPELFNRIDRIVPFDSLGRAQVRAIVARELDHVRKRDGLMLRNIELRIDDQAIDHLANIGFDAKLGARPLQRAIERQVLAPLADCINAYGRDTALEALASVVNGEMHVQVQALNIPTTKSQQALASASAVAPYLQQITAVRRKAQRLVSCSSVIELKNEVERLQRIQRDRARVKKSDAWSDPEVKKLPRLESVLTQIDSCHRQIETAEDDLAARFYTGAIQTPLASAVATETQQAWRKTLLDVYCHRFKSPDELLIAVYSDTPLRTLLLVEAYRTAAVEQGAALEYATLSVLRVNLAHRPRDGAAVRKAGDPEGADPPAELKEKDILVWRSGTKPLNEPLRSMPLPQVFGVLLRARGPHIAALFSGEAGVHRFRGIKNQVAQSVFVHTSGEAINRYRPPQELEEKVETVCEDYPLRRSYDSRSSTTDDKVLKKRTGWSIDRSAQTLPALIVSSREKLLEDMILS